jgi:hypothetical protein
LFARARESGKIAVSGRMTLARPGRNSLSVIYAALPIHAPASAQSSPAPEGFVLGVYDIEELLHFAIKRLEPRGVEVLVRDETTGDETTGDDAQFLPQFIHFYPSRLEPGATATATGWLPEQDENQPRMVATIRVGDRSWTVTCVATHTFRSAEAFTEAHWSVMVTGLLFTALLSFYLVRSRRELDNRSRARKNHLRARRTSSPARRNGRCRFLGDQRRGNAAGVYRPRFPAAGR